MPTLHRSLNLAGKWGERTQDATKTPNILPCTGWRRLREPQHTLIFGEVGIPNTSGLGPNCRAGRNHLSKHGSKQFSGPLRAEERLDSNPCGEKRKP